VESYEYQTMFSCEASYWWYRGLHGILLDVLRSVGLDERASILDAGCGTGQNLVNVGECVTPEAFGFDLSGHAEPFWHQRGLERVCRASINEIPFCDNAFDAVMSVDVLECDAVGEDRAYGELCRIVKPGGYIILVVPAYEWLLTEQHHRAVHASRRYTRKRVRDLISRFPVDIMRVSHLFALLFPAIAAYRLRLKYQKGSADTPPRSELQPLPPLVNRLLLGVVEIERVLLRHMDMPFGSSILAVARKAGAR
jgi:SAM-dependent methyltransferase